MVALGHLGHQPAIQSPVPLNCDHHVFVIEPSSNILRVSNLLYVLQTHTQHLFSYDASPFAQKIAYILTIKNIPHQRVDVSSEPN